MHLYLAFMIFLEQIKVFFMLFLVANKALFKMAIHSLKYFKNSVLFITIIYYYYRSCKYLFIFNDIETNPGDYEGLFKFCHWKLNSLVADQFSRVSSLQAYGTQNSLQIIALTEAATTKETLDEQIEIPGYSIIRNNLEEGERHGGVVIYHKMDLPVKHRLDIQNHKNTLVVELSIFRKKYSLF